MKSLYVKIFIVVLLAAAGLGLMLYQKHYLRTNFEKNARTMLRMQSLHTDIVALKHAVLRANFFLYFNNDEIYKWVQEIEKKLDALLRDPHFREYHEGTYRALVRVREHFLEEKHFISKFLTYNASLKNSSIYLPSLALKAYNIFDRTGEEGSQVILLLSKINASLFLAKNALDEAFIEEIRRYRKELSRLLGRIHEPKKRKLLTMSLRHLDLFVELFPMFRSMLNEILRLPLEKDVAQAMERFSEESKVEILRINRISELFMGLYLVMIVAIIFFIIHLEKESMIDFLTGLGNRKAYLLAKRRMEKPVLVLINIDRFKHINEYYGAQIGDRLLVLVAKELRKMVPAELDGALFRLGGDDFGLLFEEREGLSPLALVEQILRRIDALRFSIDDMPPIEITVTVGVSTVKERLFETADMALKEAKNSRRKRYVIYHPAIDKSETIARNIRATKQLKQALARGDVVPYFQPILSIKEERIIKYEALARIRLSQKDVLLPCHFLEAAKLTKMGGDLTRSILHQTLEAVRKTGYRFSVNVSAADLCSSAENDALFELLERNRPWAERLTFEILESEEIEDYEEVARFVTALRRYGVSIAIDDFGSGYSNFEKLLQLDIDWLKIDGSLIRNVDHDEHAEMVVLTIVEFARRAGVQTVAEYVHSKEVYRKVRALGIDYAQGFYVGEPQPKVR